MQIQYLLLGFDFSSPFMAMTKDFSPVPKITAKYECLI